MTKKMEKYWWTEAQIPQYIEELKKVNHKEMKELLYGKFHIIRCATVHEKSGNRCSQEGIHNIENSNDFLCKGCYKSFILMKKQETKKDTEFVF